MKAVKFNWLFVACAIVLLAGVGPATLGDWNPGDPHKMHFPQLPDPQGWDVCVVDQWVADDFKCTKTAPIDDIHFWVSWRGDIMGDINMLQPDISIWSDAGGRPGARLWTWNGAGDVAARLYGTGVQGWTCPSAGEMRYPDHNMFLQVNITKIANPFTQRKDTTYWLVVRVGLPPSVSQRIGWKTSKNNPPGPLWGKPALWSVDTLNWMEVATGTTVRQTHDMAFVINGEPHLPPIERPTLQVGPWLTRERWHEWIGPHGIVPVHLQAVDPCDQIQRVEFSWSLNGTEWVPFYTDRDGNEPILNTHGGESPQGDGWTGYLDPSQIPQMTACTMVRVKAEGWMVDSFFDIFTEVSLDPSPPDAVLLNIQDWQVVTEDHVMVDVDPDPRYPQDIQYIVIDVEVKPVEFAKGIPTVDQLDPARLYGGGQHCAPAATAACLKYFEGQGDGDICGGLSADDLTDGLAGYEGTNNGQKGTTWSGWVNGIKNWIDDHGGGYTVRSGGFDWKTARDELERCQDVLLRIQWPGDGGHAVTFNSIVNTPQSDGTIRVDAMDPYGGVIGYGNMDPASGELTDFTGPSGSHGTFSHMIIICPEEGGPGGGGNPIPGPNPDPIPIPLPDPGLYFIRVTVVDQCNHAATLIRVVEKQASEFGDAPEGALAYPDTCKKGTFPTCMNVGPAMWIRHFSSGRLFFGPKLDLEVEGNAGACPMFNPNTYNQDECFQDGDAGLILPPAYTIVSVGPIGDRVVPCVASQTGSLGTVCTAATWGKDVDIHVTNNTTTMAYVNVLMDWNRSGEWSGAIACPQCLGGAVAPEHVLVDFPVPPGYSGRLSALLPPAFMIGPYPGYIWTRFTVTPNRMGSGWTGDGVSLADGETEDYLLHVKPAPASSDCDWNVGDDHKMHHPQLPDLTPTGVDVDMFWTPLADDFKCSQTGTITDIHFWGSFADDCLPAGGPASLTFQITIYSDVPAGVDQPWSHPGEPLWTRRFEPCTYTVRQVADSNVEDWYDPATKLYLPQNHFNAYQYNICMADTDVWEQQAGRIYWLEIKDIVPAGLEPDYTFGWKTSLKHWNDDAVYRPATTGGWAELRYPVGHRLHPQSIDLAFVITGEAAPPPDTDWGDAPDPTYPTLAPIGASHTILPFVFMGAGVDGEPDGQPNVGATGDDADIDPLNLPPNFDDEDGVTFDTPMIPGVMAQITVNASLANAFISVWVDFDGDGGWGQAQDYVVQSAVSVVGNNVFQFPVPAGAVPGTQAYVRVRFTTMPQIGFAGPAPNGEVEDYVVTIQAPYEPKPPVEHVKWSQPPIEIDPMLGRMPTYCGWDEPSFSTKEMGTQPAFWQIAADDFRCLGAMPITSVHWWGSYKGWLERNPPAGQSPAYWQIAFWTNAPIDVIHPYSRPQKLLWSIRVKPERVEEVWVGMDHFPNPDVIPDSCFQYFVKLQPEECFWQEKYIASQGGDTVFWISITAVYRGFPGPVYPWGWKTRPAHWMDDGVRFSLRQDDLQLGQVLDPATITPIKASICGAEPQSFDLAFELDTDPNYIKWEQPFTGLRHWPHYEDVMSMGQEHTVTVELTKYEQVPDLTEAGIDVDATFITDTARWLPQRLADDFPCDTSGLITDIHIWSSWYHDMLPGMPPPHPGNVVFRLSIYADIPASTSPTGYSMPGAVQWTKEFQPGQFEVSIEASNLHEGYFVPCAPYFEPVGDTVCFRYDFYINPSEAFPQKGAPGKRIVYWLGVEARPIGGTTQDVRFGWKTCRYDKRWNDDAVWQTSQMPISRPWEELKYPAGHRYAGQSMDLAFKVTTQEVRQEIVINQLVADDWECHKYTPITAAVWWGSYIGYRYEACVCQTGPRPVKPDYFLLQIWPDVPANVDLPYSHPDQKPIWEYKAYNYDEVLVGFDKHPETGEPGQIGGKEPVFRYSVRLPKENWFRQKEVKGIYWFSVVAVYKDPLPVIYPWGWTNHQYIGRIDNAVAGTKDPTGAGWEWRELYDQTGMSEDMSFILFTEPGCFPSWYSTYFDWLAYGKPNCWCNSLVLGEDISDTGPANYTAGDYQCDGDANTDRENPLAKWRVSASDLSLVIANWKKPIATANPCADIKHDSENPLAKWRVSAGDLSRLISNWKKNRTQLPGNCPRPE